MRDRDRFWWLFVLAGIACGIASVVVPYHLVTTALTPAENQFVTDAEYRTDIAIDVALGLAFLGLGMTRVVMAILARRRHLVRLVAFQRDADAMPLANIRTDATRVPDLTTQPLELMWRVSRVNSAFYGLRLGISVLLALLSVGSTAVVLAAPIFMSHWPSTEDLVNSTPPQSMSVLEIILRIAGAVALIAILVGLATVLVRLMPHVFGRPFGVTATDRGVDARTEFGTRVHMDWDEVRLLEVASGNTKAQRRFDLYAPGKHIKWVEFTTGFGAQYAPVNATASEMMLRQGALPNLIVTRTRLAPRTLARRMAKAQSDSPAPTGMASMQGSLLVPAREGKRSSTAVTLLIMALIAAGIAVADFFVPVTPVPWVNWVSVGSVALAALILVIASVRELGTGNVLPAHARPPSAGAPLLDAHGAVYVFSWRVPLLRRLGLIALGFCLGFNLIPCVWIFLQMLGLYLPGSHPQFIADAPATFIVRIVLTLTFALFGVIGLGLALGGMIAGTGRVRASTDGLTTENGKLRRLLPWSSILDISWGVGSGGQFSYLVKTDVPTVQASWPAGPQTASGNPPSHGAVPIGADELAALVAAQIDKPIRVRDGE